MSQQPRHLQLRQHATVGKRCCSTRHLTATSRTSSSSSGNSMPSVAAGRREALLASALVLQQLSGLAAAAGPADAAQPQQWRSCLALADIQADYDR
jgi:hypothetical protein